MTQFIFKNDVKKPRSTKYVHTVELQEGGATYQRTAELIMKQSAAGAKDMVRSNSFILV